MKKLCVTLMAILVSGAALANSDTQISLVKKIYAEFSSVGDEYAVIKKYADADLKKAFNKAKKYQGDEICVSGFIADGQDFQISGLKVSRLNKNQVVANFKNFGQQQKVVYSLNCAGTQCKVSNVGSLKQQLEKCR